MQPRLPNAQRPSRTLPGQTCGLARRVPVLLTLLISLATTVGAQCLGSFGTFTITGNGQGVDVTGDGVDDLIFEVFRRETPGNPSPNDDAFFRVRGRTTNSALMGANQPHSSSTLTQLFVNVAQSYRSGTFDVNYPTFQGQYFQVNINGRIAFVQVAASNLSFASTDITILEVGIPQAGATAARTGDCASLSAPLPVELTAFTAERDGDDVRLAWATASETDHRGFEVQRSVDADAWSAIAFVDGMGDLGGEYAYLDHDAPPAATVYYRLLQIDDDGAATESEVISVNTAPTPEAAWRIAGANAVVRGQSVTFEGRAAATARTVQVWSAAGALVARSTIEAGSLRTAVPTTGLAPGVYFLRSVAGAARFTVL